MADPRWTSPLPAVLGHVESATLGRAVHTRSNWCAHRGFRFLEQQLLGHMFNELVLVTTLTLVAAVCFHTFLSVKTSKSLPPGPPRTFIVGNVLQIPQREPWVWCGALKEKYGEPMLYDPEGALRQATEHVCPSVPNPFLNMAGDIVYLSIFGKPMIILNSFEAVNELFLKRADIYSDRPRSIMAGEMYVNAEMRQLLACACVKYSAASSLQNGRQQVY